MRIFAYLDPATGTLIVSAVVGFFAAIALFFKNSWYKVKRSVTGKKNESADLRTDDAVTVEIPTDD